MKFKVTKKTIQNNATDALIVPIFKDEKNQVMDLLDASTGGQVENYIQQTGFDHKKNKKVVYSGGGLKAKVLVLVGLGTRKDVDSDVDDQWRRAMALGLSEANRCSAKTIAVYFSDDQKESYLRNIAATVDGLLLGSYGFDKYKTQIKQAQIVSCEIGLLSPPVSLAGIKTEMNRAEVCARAVLGCRDLVNEPANVLGPEAFGELCEKVAEQTDVQCKILKKQAIKQQKMNLLLAVGGSSNREPRFVHMIHKPKGKKTFQKIVLVGKGVTFDSGGLCLKPALGMLTMKTDMSGGAVVLSVMSALAKLKVNLEVHGLIPICDNFVDQAAMRPGDVYTAANGTTVEITNTDAEGRLLLADALAYGVKLAPNEIIDVATLTGACKVALGTKRAGLFSNSDPMAAGLLAAAQDCGELLWPLPLAEELNGELKSTVADIKNSGGRFGGSISAALFLKKFIKDIPWAHLDIAGPARLDRGTLLCPKGGTGFGVQTLITYLLSKSGN